MNVGDIKQVIEDYLQVGTTDTSPNGVDLTLRAVNNARKHAERLHDFNASIVTVSLSVDPTNGGSILAATKEFGSSDLPATVDIKNIRKVRVDVANSNVSKVIRFMSHGEYMSTLLEKREANSSGWDYRYPGSSNDDNVSGVRTIATIHGDLIFLQPTPDTATTIYIDGHAWHPDYTANGDEDFFTKHGADYLIWAGVVELNHLLKTLVPRQEGNLSPPERLKQDALKALILMDDHQHIAGSNMTLA